MENIIIHISGAYGSGKTTLGNKLKEEYGNKITVVNIDDLRIDFIRDFYGNKRFDIIDKNEYQKYIDKFVENHTAKPLIFVGLNNMYWWHKNHYYNLHSKYNYYIELDAETIVKQKCRRLFLDLANKEYNMEYLVQNNKDYIKSVANVIADECDLKKTIMTIKKWKKDYTKQGYKFMSRDDIFKKVSKILKNIITS